MPDKPKTPAQSDSERLSLHGMTPEEAIQRAFGTKPTPPKSNACAKCGSELEYRSAGPGGGTITCPKCGVVGAFDNVKPKDFWDKITGKKS